MKNLNGKLYVHNDEAGRLTYTDYDSIALGFWKNLRAMNPALWRGFKGNLLNFYRQIINDNAVTAFRKYVVDWDNFPSGNLSTTQNTVTQVRSVVGFCGAKTVQMSIPLFSGKYDALNRIRKAYYPKDKTNQVKVLEPTYNKGGALRAVKVGTTNYVSEIAYNARGQRILMAMGNGIMTRYVYDSVTFRLARTRSEKFTLSGLTYTPTTGVQQDLGYTYDLEGTILSQRDKAPANTSAQGPGDLLREFGHDPLRRLISATGRESSNIYQQLRLAVGFCDSENLTAINPALFGGTSWDLNIRPQDYTDTNIYTREYVYDKLGNIQELDHRAVGHSNQDFVRTYNYGTSFANNHLESFEIGSNTFSNNYNPNGNLTKEGASRYYYWNAGDKLAAYSNQVGSSDPTVYTWYFYNSSGERVKKLVKKGQRLEVTFYMDGGMFETSYVKPTGGGIDNNRFYNTLHVLDGSSRISTIRVGTDADDSTPAIKYYLEDHLMDNLVVLNTSGNLVNREEFYPFGETSFGGYGKKRYRFNRKEKDEESGLYNYGQRYYAPWLCRFVSVDPIAEDYPQYTSYNYAGNKPVSKMDLEGLQEEGAENEPVTGKGQLPDATPGVATFLLNEIVISGTSKSTKQESSSSNPSNLIGPIKDLAIEEGKKAVDYRADSKVADNIANDIKSDNYDRPVKTTKASNADELAMQGKSIHKDKGYYDAHRNQIVTTRGQGYETREISDFRNNGKLAFEALGVVTDVYGLFDVVKNNSDPFTALPMIGPIAEINSQRMRNDNFDNLKMAVSLGYETTRDLLGRSSNLREAIGEYTFLELTGEELSHFASLSESGFIDDKELVGSGSDNWRHAVLFQGHDEGWSIFAVFMNANTK